MAHLVAGRGEMGGDFVVYVVDVEGFVGLAIVVAVFGLALFMCRAHYFYDP